MKRLCQILLLSMSLALVACGKAEPESKTAQEQEFEIPASVAPSLEAARKYARGFDTGNMMSARQVFVFFDPQCPHCGAFWNETKSLEKDARFTWVPVSFLGAKSLTQGATILYSPNPVAAMAEHEAKLAANQGGIEPTEVDPKFKAIVTKNTRLLESFGATGVPFVLSINQKTGQTYSNSGGMPAALLAQNLGWTLEPESATASQGTAGAPVASAPPARK